MELKTVEVAGLYALLKDAKYSRMERKAKMAFIRILCEITSIAENFQKKIQTIQDKLKPENFDELNEKRSNFASLTSEQQVELDDAFNKYYKEVDEAIKPFGEEIVELKSEKLSEEQFEGFVDTNDYTAGQIVEIYKYIVNR